MQLDPRRRGTWGGLRHRRTFSRQRQEAEGPFWLEGVRQERESSLRATKVPSAFTALFAAPALQRSARGPDTRISTCVQLPHRGGRWQPSLQFPPQGYRRHVCMYAFASLVKAPSTQFILQNQPRI